jgi:hypothetical protein
MFFQSVCIWLIQIKLVLIDNRPTEFHQGHSAFLEMKHANRWILHAHYTGCFIMYSRIIKIYGRKTVGHICTKPVQIAATNQKMFSQSVVFHRTSRFCHYMMWGRVIGHASGNDWPLMLWPPRSPDIMPCDFVLWWYVKDQVFISPLPCDLAHLKAWIIAAVKNIDAPMLMC